MLLTSWGSENLNPGLTDSKAQLYITPHGRSRTSGWELGKGWERRQMEFAWPQALRPSDLKSEVMLGWWSMKAGKREGVTKHCQEDTPTSTHFFFLQIILSSCIK